MNIPAGHRLQHYKTEKTICKTTETHTMNNNIQQQQKPNTRHTHISNKTAPQVNTVNNTKQNKTHANGNKPTSKHQVTHK